MGKNDKLSKGLMAIGFAVLLFFIPQFLNVCPTCTSCEGWNLISLECQQAHWGCVAVAPACAAYAWGISQFFLGASVILLLYGIYKIVK